MCISKCTPTQRSPFCGKLVQTRLNASARHSVKKTQDAPGTKFKFGKQKGHLPGSFSSCDRVDSGKWDVQISRWVAWSE